MWYCCIPEDVCIEPLKIMTQNCCAAERRAANDEAEDEAESRKQSGNSAETSGSKRVYPGKTVTVDPSEYDDYSQAVDALWSMLPLDKLRRPGEAAWDIDKAGPTGPERFDNAYGKVCLLLHALHIDTIKIQKGTGFHAEGSRHTW